MCYDRIKQNFQQEELFWVLGSRVRLSQCCCSRADGQLTESDEFERSTGSGGGKAESGAQILIKGSSGLMRGDGCKQSRVRGEQSCDILCEIRPRRWRDDSGQAERHRWARASLTGQNYLTLTGWNH